MEQSDVFLVRISPDEQKAQLTIHRDANAVMSVEKLKEILKANGVIHGYKEDVLIRIVETLKTRPVAPNLVVAEGSKPIPGKKPTVKFHFESASTRPGERRSGRTDYRDVSNIIKVQKDQVLAVKKLMKPPVNGKTVTGRELSPPHIYDIPVEAGENVAVKQNGDTLTFTATVDGSLTFARDTFAVSSSFKINRDVDFRVGNIRFSGNVHVGRDVKPGFVVQAGEHIFIGGSAVGCRLTSGGNLDVEAGISGKGKGQAVAKGNINASYVENAHLVSLKNISVKNSISSSSVICNGSITVETPGARVVNSTLKAAKGITVYNVGSRVDHKSRLITGIVPEYEQEYTMIKRAMDAKTKEILLIEKRYGKEALETKSFTRISSRRMKTDIEKWDLMSEEIKMSKEILDRAESLMYDHSAVITIKQALFPGIYLRIGRFEFTPAREYYNVTIHYSKDLQKLALAKNKT